MKAGYWIGAFAAGLLLAAGVCAAEDKGPRTLGVLLFPGFELLDATGPIEMWGNLKPQIRALYRAALERRVALTEIDMSLLSPTAA